MARGGRALAAALLAAALLAASVGNVEAHGYMTAPASRNYIHSTYMPRTAQEKANIPESYWNYCPHCLAAGGPGEVSAGGQLTWPVGQNGLCGDMFSAPRDHEAGGRFATEEVGGTYEEGGVMEFKVAITAHHNGRFELKVCKVMAPAVGQTWVQAERAQLTPECFNQHVLVQANVEGSQRPFDQYSYLPHKTWGGYAFDLTPAPFKYYYTVPDGLGCDGVQARCVLQMHWVTGNSCTPPGTPEEFQEPQLGTCGVDGPYPEEFWNCADIRTTPRAGGVGVPAKPPPPPRPPAPPVAPPSPSPPPPPPPSPEVAGGYPCASGDAVCFCRWKGRDGNYADVKRGCEFFYQCVWGGVPGHTACDAGLRFHEVGGYCDYPYNVNCPLPDAGDNEEVDSLGTPAPPPPPADPWDEWNSQPQTGPAATCGATQFGTELLGADLPAGIIDGVSSLSACCDSCRARPECGAFTLDKSDSRCYLKRTTGWSKKTGDAGKQSAFMVPATSDSDDLKSPPPPAAKRSPPPPPPAAKRSPPPPPPAAKRSPPPPPPVVRRSPPPPPPARSPPPPPVAKVAPATTCGSQQKGMDLWGGDLPTGGVVNASSFGACCKACRGNARCGAFTFVKSAKKCYLKYSSGWKSRTNAASSGMTSGVLLGRSSPQPRRTRRSSL